MFEVTRERVQPESFFHAQRKSPAFAGLFFWSID